MMGHSADNINRVLPYYPNFKPLDWCDRDDIEAILHKSPIYSDFNVTSLNIWNVQNEMQVCILHDNIVVRFSDYITGKPFISFCGGNKPSETAHILLKHSFAEYGLQSLKLIPETIATNISEAEFIITPDRDAFDYVYPLPFLATLSEQPAKCKPATNLRSFLKSCDVYSSATDFLGWTNVNELKNIFKKWASNKGVNYRELHEFLAFERLLHNSNANLLITTVSLSGETVGFIICEILNPETAICHFYKADVKYKGVYEAILWEAAKVLYDYGIHSLNFEQDLGIENLRRSKEKYKQHTFLKKYTIEKREQ